MKYDQTPVAPEDEIAFADGVGFETKADLDQAEGEAISDTLGNLLELLDSGDLEKHDLLAHGTLAQLHRDAFETIWLWAGRLRVRETSIGVPPEQVSMALREAEDDLAFLVSELPAREFAMVAHWRMVRVHPFVDGNGRITRAFADALLFASTGEVFDWVEGAEYYAALRAADATLKVDALLELIGVLTLE